MSHIANPVPTYPSNKKCSELGCNEPRSRMNTYCTKHGGRDNLRTRETDSIYQTAAWQSIRNRQLSIQPLCQACLSRGHIESAIHVDHVFPWRHIGSHAFTRNLFQSLCKPDHSHKTALERQGKFTHYMVDGERIYAASDYNYVMRDL